MCDSSERDRGNGGKQLHVKQTVKQYYGEPLQNRLKDYFTITGDCNEHLGECEDCSTASPGKGDPLNTLSSERCC